jgi:hypothetical protein
MGVRHIFVCNRTVATAHALAEHYNRLIDEDVIKDARESDGTAARVRVIEKFTDQWPQEFSYPTMVVCTIPAQKQDGTAPTSFTVPDSWLRSPTGGVAVEVSLTNRSSLRRRIVHDTNTHPPALLQPNGHILRPPNAPSGETRLDPDGWIRPPARASFRPIRTVHRPSSAQEADERCSAGPLSKPAEQADRYWSSLKTS